jgi:phage gp36-like protein
MAYATFADLQARYPNQDLVQLSNQDPTVTTIDDAYLTQALADASAEIDAYLEGRYALPLADIPAMLPVWCCRIAIYNLQQLRPLHDLADARDRYDDAIKQLEKVAKGEINLGLTTDNNTEAPTAPGSTVIAQPRGGNVFTRDRLRGY